MLGQAECAGGLMGAEPSRLPRDRLAQVYLHLALRMHASMQTLLLMS